MTDRRASAPANPAQQTSQNYHPVNSSTSIANSTTRTNLSNPNPFITPTRPRIEAETSDKLSTSGLSMADRVRSLSTSSMTAGSGPSALGRGSEIQASSSTNEQARSITSAIKPGVEGAVEGGIQRGKDMFSWFQDTVVISMIVRNWPN